MEIRIFYSWISQYGEANKRFVRKCINKAVDKLEKKRLPELNGISFKVIESLGENPGHQVLSTTQEKEICNSDIFIGDWTVIDPYSLFERIKSKCFFVKII